VAIATEQLTAAPTWRSLFDDVRRRLGSEDDARRIVERASGGSSTWWHLSSDETAPPRAVAFVDELVARRAAGEPLQYVVGRWGFRALELYVDRRVLIPRPETEVVVEVALEALRALVGTRPSVVADLGTGSGAIALSLAAELPNAEVWATELSPDALAVARANLAGLGGMAAPRVRLLEGSWFEPLPAELRGRLDLVVANPPYVASGESLPAEVAEWEPAAALIAGPTGLEAIIHIVEAAPGWLARPGALVVEVAPHQEEAARHTASRAGFRSVDVRRDLAGRPRALVAVHE
jgi:release factor glutamine methyltransferase